MKILWIVCILGALAVGCSKDRNDPELPYAPFQIEDLVVGTGSGAVGGNVLTMHYTSQVFGSDDIFNSRDNDGDPIDVTIGIDVYIDGWETGLPDLQVGGIRKMTIPPEMAFGEVGNSDGSIPPNATVIYTNELLALDQSFMLEDVVVGTGVFPFPGAAITVSYKGTLTDGTVFDSTATGEPFTFTIGLGSVITGWEEGLRTMRVGGTRRLTIPPEKGYGSSTNGSIPANSTLIFVVDLLAVN